MTTAIHKSLSLPQQVKTNKRESYTDLHVEPGQSQKLCLLLVKKALIVASQEKFFLTAVTLSAQPMGMFHVNQGGPSNSKYMSFNSSTAEACI